VTGRGNPQIGSEFDKSNVLNIIQQDNALLRQKVQQLEAEIGKIKKKQLPRRKTKVVKSKRRHT
jgi:hypothetical protein